MSNLRVTAITVSILLVGGCAAKTPNASSAVASAAPYKCTAGPTPQLRSHMPPDSFKPDGQLNWPKDGGFDPPKLKVVVQPGELLDRFGDTCGTFFSPEGAPYDGRALPYECHGYAYSVYRVLKPLPVTIGTAAKAFGEPGGAIQLKTSELVDQLLSEGVLEKVDGAAPLSCEVH
jgi:hypothetical protein